MPILDWIYYNPMISFLVALLVVLLANFMFVFFSNNPRRFLKKLGASDKFQALKFLGLSMGGILFVIQIAISSGVNQNAEQGLRQERMKNAIEHLGDNSEAVRLGGGYELFHLAEDTEELRRTVLDILCAHIRRTTGESEYTEKYRSKPSEEIQSLLSLLFVQEYKVFEGLNIKLKESWLQGANLSRAHLEKADLAEAHLEKADLVEAHLQGANLWEAHLQGAYLFGAKLQGTYLFGAQLQGAVLIGARLQGAYLQAAGLQEANLHSAQLQGVRSNINDMRKSFADHMRNAANKETDLSGVIFKGGLNREEAESIVKDFSDEKGRQLRTKLERHIDKPPSYQLPKNSGAITEAYTEKEAEQWIAEYEKAMAEVAKADNEE